MQPPETEIETDPKSKSVQFLNWILCKLESRANRVSSAADNHQLISKLTFILVAGMSYEILGEKVITLISILI